MKTLRKRIRKIIIDSLEIDLEKDDVILTGKFKNKRRIVKNIGKDDLGQPTVNDRSALKFRIEKEMPKEKWSKKSKEELKDIQKENKMKISKRQLRKIIREACYQAINESPPSKAPPPKKGFDWERASGNKIGKVKWPGQDEGKPPPIGWDPKKEAKRQKSGTEKAIRTFGKGSKLAKKMDDPRYQMGAEAFETGAKIGGKMGLDKYKAIEKMGVETARAGLKDPHAMWMATAGGWLGWGVGTDEDKVINILDRRAEDMPAFMEEWMVYLDEFHGKYIDLADQLDKEGMPEEADFVRSYS